MNKSTMGLVGSMGLTHLSELMQDTLDTSLISTFVVQWKPDANSFHLPRGDMTILLFDV